MTEISESSALNKENENAAAINYGNSAGNGKSRSWKHYAGLIMAGFITIALSIILYFIIARQASLFDALKGVLGIIRPFVIGGAFAYILRPFCSFVERLLNKIMPAKLQGMVSGLSIAAGLLMAVVIIYLLLIAVVPQLIISISTLTRQLPNKANELFEQIEEYFDSNVVITNYLNTIYDQAAAWLKDWVNSTILPYLKGMVTNIGSGIADFFDVLMDTFVGVIVAIYLLQGRKRFKDQAKLLLNSLASPKASAAILEEVSFADKVFNGFLSGKVLDSTIIGVLCYIFSLIVKLPNAMLISVIVGVTNIIPFFGPYIGAIPSFFLLLVSSPRYAVIFLVFIIILQQVDGNIIGPKILGNSTGLSSFWVLFAILFFGGIWGLIGMIVGVPVFAVIYDIIRKIVTWKLEKRGESDLMDSYNRKWHSEK